MSDVLPGPEAQALEWAVLADAPDFDGWAALEAWLAADPLHAILFDRATIAIDEAASAIRAAPARDRLSLLPSAPADPAGYRRRAPRLWLPLGIAAALVGTIGAGAWLARAPVAPSSQTIATKAGTLRTIDLDGARITLNGDTAIRFDPARPREIALERGQASFAVSHDAARPFSVRGGAVMIRDIGTRFDVARNDGGTVVAVAEGEVSVEAAGAAVRLRAGERSDIAAGGTPSAPQPIVPVSVGAWQSGQLSYEDATLDRVIADVRRRTGLAIRLSPGLAKRRFAGSLNVHGDAETVIERIKAVLGISAQREGAGWLLTPRHADTRH